MASDWADTIYTNVEIHLDIADRILVFLGMPIGLSVKTRTENLPGKVEGDSRVSVGRVDILRRLGIKRRLGEYEETPNDSVDRKIAEPKPGA